MAQTNQKRPPAKPAKTHTGGPAVRGTAYAQLRRTVLNCLLWEDNFHESGEAVGERIRRLVTLVNGELVFNLAIEARSDFGLRHVPLLLAREMARGSVEQRALVPALLPAIIQRADEIAEFTALYWATNDGKKFVSHPVRRGLATALSKFNLFQLAKWDKRDKAVRIRDALFMVHAKPHDLPANAGKWAAAERKEHRKTETRPWPFTERETIQFEVAQDLLVQQGTWEDRMSAGEAPLTVFSDLMERGELGALAFIRNVRKMAESKVDDATIRMYSTTVPLRGVFPHQLITAARVNPQYESIFDAMLSRLTVGMPKLAGRTAVLVDVSGSMDQPLAKRPAASNYKSNRKASAIEETKRMDAAAAVAIMAQTLCESVRIFTFSDTVVEVPARSGMALRDAILKSQLHRNTYLAKAVSLLNDKYDYKRIIVITDEQSHDGVSSPRQGTMAYMLNVAPYEHSVANAGQWEKIDGWSPAVIRFITALESDLLEENVA